MTLNTGSTELNCLFWNNYYTFMDQLSGKKINAMEQKSIFDSCFMLRILWKLHPVGGLWLLSNSGLEKWIKPILKIDLY